jgi:hypothetical protein
MTAQLGISYYKYGKYARPGALKSISNDLSLFYIANIFDNFTSLLLRDIFYNGAPHLFTFKSITGGATEKVNNQGKPISAAPIGSTLFLFSDGYEHQLCCSFCYKHGYMVHSLA